MILTNPKLSIPKESNRHCMRILDSDRRLVAIIKLSIYISTAIYHTQEVALKVILSKISLQAIETDRITIKIYTCQPLT